jgi:adenine C2-methylase RlmN of 23S rRNA A2503 and tRNA A37
VTLTIPANGKTITVLASTPGSTIVTVTLPRPDGTTLTVSTPPAI